MNYQFGPDSINNTNSSVASSTITSDSNAATSTEYVPQTQTQNQTQAQEVNQYQNNAPKNSLTFSNKIYNFLTSKTGTIIATAFGMSLGFAFKDLILSFVSNVIQPLFIYIISITHLNSFELQDLVSTKNNILNVSTFISSFITFVFILLTVYYIDANISVVN